MMSIAAGDFANNEIGLGQPARLNSRSRKLRNVVNVSWFVCILTMAGCAFAGTIHTLDGKTYEGEIRITSGQSLHIIGKDGQETGVKLTKVLDAAFNTSQSSTIGTGTIARGVVLTDGAAIAGNIDSIGEKFVRITPSDVQADVQADVQGPTIQLPINTVARVVFQPVTDDLLSKAPVGSSGVLLKGGDFMEGQLRNYDGRLVRVDSALFGVTDFDTQERAIALVLRPADRLDGDLIVRTIHGSQLVGEMPSLDHGQLRFNARGIGPVAIRQADLAEIRVGGNRLVPLALRRPDAIEGGDPPTVFAVDKTTIGLSPRLLGPSASHLVVLSSRSPSGAGITYELSGQYDVFTARVGVPVEIVPMQAMRFAVEVDGRESAACTLTSCDDPVTLSVDIHDARKIRLLVSCPAKESCAVIGAWADPLLVREHVQQTPPAAPAAPKQ